MSGIPPNILQLLQLMQQQQGPGAMTPGQVGGVAPPQNPQAMAQQAMAQQAMGGPGGGAVAANAPGHAAYHLLRMQNPNLPPFEALSPQQRMQFAGPQNPQAMQQAYNAMPGGQPGGIPPWAQAGRAPPTPAGAPSGFISPPNFQQAQAMQQAYNAQPQNMGGQPGGGNPMAAMPPGMAPPPPNPQAMAAANPIKSFKKGGTVEKTGVYRLHKGERVIPAGKTAPTRHHASDKKTTVRHASGKAPQPKSTPVKHASARHAPPPKKRK